MGHRIKSAAVILGALLFAALVFAGCSSKPKVALNPQQEHGEKIFRADCAQCHFPDSTRSRGGPGLENLFHKQWLPSGAPADDAHVRQTIEMGRGNMPRFSQVLDDRQMDDLLAYLHTL